MGGGQRPSVSWWPWFAQRGAKHQLLVGPVGQTAWACSVRRHRDVAASVAAALTDPPTHAHHLQGAADSRGFLHSVGFETAEWAALADGLRPRQPAFQDIEPGVPTHGWQFFAARAIEELRLLFHRASVVSHSMVGLFSVVPSSSFVQFCPQLFRVLLLRRLWLPPLSSRTNTPCSASAVSSDVPPSKICRRKRPYCGSFILAVLNFALRYCGPENAFVPSRRTPLFDSTKQ